MKKIISILLVLFMAAGFASCGSSKIPVSDDLTKAQQYYDGDWYGFWILNNPNEGSVMNVEDGSWWDCCAHIDVADDGTAEMTLWDECDTEETYTIKAYLDISRGGVATISSASFFQCDISDAGWEIDPSGNKYENMLVFDGHYDDGEDSFDYTFIMKRWGETWDDVAADNGDLPYGYESWYLPLIEANEPVPSTIEIEY